MAELAEWIHPTYLRVVMAEKIAAVFEKEGMVELQGFLLPKRYKELQRAATTYSSYYAPDRYKYAWTGLPQAAFFDSPEFREYVELLTGFALGKTFSAKFTKGDYTLLNDKDVFSGLQMNFNLTDGWDPAWGGVVHYKLPTGDVRYGAISGNTLQLVKCSKDVQMYVSYVNYHAKKAVRFIAARSE